uniref:Phytanoyl-CoA dioxygenase n=1 Tax=Hemiselmis tepida TaxID=464990 RepID=A0A7S0WCX9_9CRYP|mmetsp:Transcript_37395/g.95545  ORF Transcript_37395/g.95545 Transcript_37395/m.95545 type:complete len:286 (+) Transcript_37395:3-860(+)
MGVGVPLQDERTRELLAARGFSHFEGVDWEALGVRMSDVAATMQRLKDEGWPPVFVFMYDEPWRMLEGLFDVLSPLLGDPGEEVELEASVYGWALERPAEGPAGERVGGNFGQPHRDQGFDTCHLADGSSSILSVWVPTVDTDLDNGCMYVVPRECDALFSDPEHKQHLAPHTFNFPYQSIRPLPGLAGSVFCWHPNTIHWGSAASAHSTAPSRKSLAMSFRVPQHRQAFTKKEMDACGRAPFTRQELRDGVGVRERWNLCSKGVLMYSVWHPDFAGFDIEKNLA